MRETSTHFALRKIIIFIHNIFITIIILEHHIISYATKMLITVFKIVLANAKASFNRKYADIKILKYFLK